MKCEMCKKRVRRTLSDWLAGWRKALATGKTCATKEQATLRFNAIYGNESVLCRCKK